ncbi:MAG: energy transducer TonB [Candidatus Omnitrophica bacterium]|nr:energy transducer TonB [Candidatus Omnitrophota bacterium]
MKKRFFLWSAVIHGAAFGFLSYQWMSRPVVEVATGRSAIEFSLASFTPGAAIRQSEVYPKVESVSDPAPLFHEPVSQKAAEARTEFNPAPGVVSSSQANLLENRPPAYPRAARLIGAEGTVVLQIIVGENGRSVRVEIEESSGHATLDQAAVKTARSWRFEPARRFGKAVVSTLEIPVVFKLTK